MRHRAAGIPALALAAFIALAPPAPAQDREALIQCAEVQLRIAGVFNIGTASLHLADCRDARRILESVPKQFSLELARDMAGQDLIDSANALLVDNLDVDAPEDLPDELACLANAYVDANKGERFDVVYQPASGLALYRNDELLEACPDQGRGAEYFSIWFGEAPFHRRLRDRLIEQALE